MTPPDPPDPLRPAPCSPGHAPPPDGTDAALRRAVREHADLERRRVFAPVLHVGHPGGRVARVPVGDPDGTTDDRVDHGLASELVAALRDRVVGDATHHGTEPLVWLTRRGALAVEDVDLRWLRAARAAYAEAGAPLVFAVVTRHGWLDPATGGRRRWSRVRRDRP